MGRQPQDHHDTVCVCVHVCGSVYQHMCVVGAQVAFFGWCLPCFSETEPLSGLGFIYSGIHTSLPSKDFGITHTTKSEFSFFLLIFGIKPSSTCSWGEHSASWASVPLRCYNFSEFYYGHIDSHCLKKHTGLKKRNSSTYGEDCGGYRERSEAHWATKCEKENQKGKGIPESGNGMIEGQRRETSTKA